MASLLSIFVPESLGHKLPDSIEDAKKMADHQKPFWKWYSSQELRDKILDNQHIES